MLVDAHVEKVKTSLAGLVDREIIRPLGANITSGDVTLAPASATPPGVGDGTILELDYELIYVYEADPDSPWTHYIIRGYGGTTAAAHTTTDLITYDPVFSRHRILTEMQQAIESFDSNIYKVTTVNLTFDKGDRLTDLTGATGDVLQILDARRADSDGAELGVFDLPLELLPNMATGDFPSSWAVRIADGSVFDQDQVVRVTYASRYGVADHTAGGTSTLTGRLLDAVENRAKAVMVGDLENSRLTMTRQGQARHPEDVPATSNLRLASYYEQMAHERMSDERSALQARYPWAGF